ncbi:MAG: hypothetical protein QN773_09960 [Nitrososphaeraceae archaeon]|nr:hypothetical protein [Nitrososphaeraceae archaeon]
MQNSIKVRDTPPGHETIYSKLIRNRTILIEDPWTYVFAWAGLMGSGATAAALFFLWKQSRQTKKQYN